MKNLFNMKKLWILGDSWCTPWDKVNSKDQKEYVKRYQPKLHISNILQDKLGCDEVINLARGGNCNYSIFESLCKNVNRISKDDIIVIGWSEITRWRNLTVNSNDWTSVYVNFHQAEVPKSFIQECVNRDSHLSADEVNNWISFIDKCFPNQVIHWTPFQKMIEKWEHLNIESPNFEIERINDVTDLKDYHPTEASHVTISEWLLSRKLKKLI
jgi:hypothetical protein